MNFAAQHFSCEIFCLVSTTCFFIGFPIFYLSSSKKKFSIKKELKFAAGLAALVLFLFVFMGIDFLPGFIDSYHCYEKSLRFGDRAGAECLKTVRKGTYAELFKKYFLQ